MIEVELETSVGKMSYLIHAEIETDDDDKFIFNSFHVFDRDAIECELFPEAPLLDLLQSRVVNHVSDRLAFNPLDRSDE